MADTFADDIFKFICLNEIVWTSNTISLKFVPKGPNYSKSALIQVMAWRWTGDKPVPDPVHHCIYAALGGDELTPCGTTED